MKKLVPAEQKISKLKILLAEAEEDIKHGRVRPAREFLKDFKRHAAKKIRVAQNATTL